MSTPSSPSDPSGAASGSGEASPALTPHTTRMTRVADSVERGLSAMRKRTAQAVGLPARAFTSAAKLWQKDAASDEDTAETRDNTEPPATSPRVRFNEQSRSLSKAALSKSGRFFLAPSIMPRVPRSMDAVDLRFLSQALREGGAMPRVGKASGGIVSVTFEPMLQGFLSDVGRFRIEYAFDSVDSSNMTESEAMLLADGAGDKPSSSTWLPRSVVVKLAAADASALTVATESDCYAQEERYYKELSSLIGDESSPRCFMVAAEEMSGAYAYVLEDLTLRPGLEFRSQELGLGMDSALAMAASLGGIHSTFWEQSGALPISWLPHSENVPLRSCDVVAECADAFAASEYFEEMTEAERATTLACWSLASELKRELQRPPFTLLHGDPRADNCFWCADGGVVFLDWQLLSQGMPMLDLAWFTTTSVIDPPPTEGRDREIVRVYWESLTASGVVDPQLYTVDMAWREYLIGVVWAFCMLVQAVRFDVPPERKAMLKHMITRPLATVIALGCLDVPMVRLTA